MNLAFDPWIPCIRDDGGACSASLVQCFTDAGIVDVAVRPHERVALMRLLLCVAYAACGVPADYEEWMACRERLPDEADRYLEKWRDSFELFHPQKPFLQVAGLKSAAKNSEESGQTTTARLDFSLATGVNSTLFDHGALDAERAFTPESLALNLLTFQMFTPSGPVGNAFWNEEAIPRYTNDAICLPSSMLHTFLRGANLGESLFLNMATEDELTGYSSLGGDWKGRPLWEMFPNGPKDAGAVRNATQTFLGRMVPLSRAIVLLPGGRAMIWGNGLSFPVFDAFPAEPSATVIVADKGDKRRLLGAQPGKAVWRQLHALTLKRHYDKDGGLGGCIALGHCEDAEAVDITVCALIRNPEPGKQGEIVDMVESVFHVPGTMFRDEGRMTYESAVGQAEDLERALGRAVETWRTVVDGGWAGRLKMAGSKKHDERAKLRAVASREYWTAVEHNLPLLLAMTAALGSPDFPQKQAQWQSLLRQSALRAYAMACGRDNERQMRGFVAGKRLLLGSARKILGQPEKEE